MSGEKSPLHSQTGCPRRPPRRSRIVGVWLLLRSLPRYTPSSEITWTRSRRPAPIKRALSAQGRVRCARKSGHEWWERSKYLLKVARTAKGAKRDEDGQPIVLAPFEEVGTLRAPSN